MKTLSLILSSFIVFATSEVKAQNISKPVLDSLCDEMEQLLGDDWFISRTKHGFNVYFCRSCQEEYKQYLNENDWPHWKTKYDFFSLEKLDSVAYYPTVSAYGSINTSSDSLYDASMKVFYKADDILMFEIQIERKWEEKKYDSIYSNNELLKTEILKEPLYKSNENIFSDYRFWLPSSHWKNRTKELNLFFQRLPYSSLTLDYSIFIIPDKPYYFCNPFYVDKTDSEYYDNKANELDAERRKTLKIIALVLGVHDYQIVN